MPTRVDQWGRLHAVAAQQMAQADALTPEGARALERAWLLTQQAVERDLADVLRRVALARRMGVPLSPSYVVREARLRQALAQCQRHLMAYARAREAALGPQSAAAVRRALDHARALVDAAEAANGGVSVDWGAPNADALANAQAFQGPGSPLRALFDRTANDGVNLLADRILQGVALGHNPRRIAADVRQAAGYTRYRAELIARTETLRAYREATRQSFLANPDVVTGWTWQAALDRRCCPACVAMSGTEHKPTERLDGHPQCRCVMLPITPTYRDMGVDVADSRSVAETGPEWYARQPADVQVSVMGPGKARAIAQGRAKVTDMVEQTRSEAWGTMRRERSLTNALRVADRRANRTAAERARRAKAKAARPIQAPSVNPTAVRASEARMETLRAKVTSTQALRARLAARPSPDASLLSSLDRQVQAAEQAVAREASRLEHLRAGRSGLETLPRLATPDGTTGVLAHTNPLYLTPGGDVNCTHVVAAAELRHRGYDVTASVLPEAMRPDGGRMAVETVSRWLDPHGNPAHLSAAALHQVEGRLLRQWPDGARGWCVVKWAKGGGGHIFNVRVRGGRLVAYDAQNGKVLDSLSVYLNRGKGSAYFVRTDNLTPTDDVIDLLNEGVTP